jgi:hypothetical protein
MMYKSSAFNLQLKLIPILWNDYFSGKSTKNDAYERYYRCLVPVYGEVY